MKTALAILLILSLVTAAVLPLRAGEVIDVNRAGSAQLERLYRVNPRVAGMIVTEREKNGPYLSLDDLSGRVRGIGPRTVARWEGLAVALP